MSDQQDTPAFTQLAGGVIRVHTRGSDAPSPAASDTPSAPPSLSPAKAGYGQAVVNPNTGQVEAREVETFQQFSTQELRGPGLLGTAMTPWGTPTTELKEDTLVTFNGMSMTLKNAEVIGLVTRTGNGGYAETNAARDGAVQELVAELDRLAENPTHTQPVPFSDQKAEQAVAWLDSSLPPQARLALTEKTLSGGVTEAELHNLEAVYGLPKDSLKAAVEQVSDAFDAQAVAAFTEAGLPAELVESFKDWANGEREAQYLDAIRQHLYGRNPGKYAALVREFMVSTVPSAGVKELEAQGYKVRVHSSGARLVTLPGYPEMQVSTAARLGLL